MPACLPAQKPPCSPQQVDLPPSPKPHAARTAPSHAISTTPNQVTKRPTTETSDKPNTISPGHISLEHSGRHS